MPDSLAGWTHCQRGIATVEESIGDYSTLLSSYPLPFPS
jgi:hypothetical protein